MFYRAITNKKLLIVLNALLVTVSAMLLFSHFKQNTPYEKEPPLKPTTLPITYTMKQTKEELEADENPGLICQYIDVYTASFEEVGNNDDIQDIIGYQNNKVGLYIYAEVEEFSNKAAELANSNGGDWGYVLIPYNVKDRNEDRWDKLFSNLEDLHLIPIVQLWDIDIDDPDETLK